VLNLIVPAVRTVVVPTLLAASLLLSSCERSGAQIVVEAPLSDAERQRIVDSVVPNEPFRPSLELCENEAGPRIDARGEVYRTDFTGLSIPAPGCILGAKVIGTFDRGLGWADVKRDHDGDGIRWSRPEPGLVHVIGAYIDNIEDPIGPPKSPETDRRSTWKVEHVYARYTRDDFVENDACLDGHVRDSLVDGAHVFISARPGRSNQAEMAKYKATHTVTNSLIHLDCKPDPRTDTKGSCPPGQSTMIPAKWSACGGILNMKDTIIRIDGRARMGTRPMAFPPGEYENVWLIYLGPENAYPGELPLSGITEVRDLELWQMARDKWLQRHGCDAVGDHCTMLDE
jgi:hypothetical protein